MEPIVSSQLVELLKEFIDIFAWTYKYLKGIPPKKAQHRIEPYMLTSPLHQEMYQLNINYVTIVKQNIIKLIVVGFIKLIEEATWLSPIVVMLKKYGKQKICVDFRLLNGAVVKKDPHLLLMKLLIL